MLDLFGLSHQNKMLLRLYAMPLLFLVGTFIVLIAEDILQAATATPYMFNVLYMALWWVSLLLLGVACITFLYSTFLLWKWDKGEAAEMCHICGGIVTDRNGKYGPYYKCLACGANRSMYR
ncbi:hypothetical protein [Methylotuvimicrobium sp.]|uniref:hypothetical protein n=1 Tax=Methylotuvimicrobium sp. TaxID=2822413 RepID=UPI003D64916A